jgi:hypothetical protein
VRGVFCVPCVIQRFVGKVKAMKDICLDVDVVYAGTVLGWVREKKKHGSIISNNCKEIP